MDTFKVGDKVIIYTLYHGYDKKNIHFKQDVVKSISQKKKEITLEISKDKYRENGSKIGHRERFSMSETTLKLLTPELVKELNDYTKREKSIAILESIKWKELSDDAIISVMIAYEDAMTRESR
jgi:hypothetical protein